ncbi:MAG: acyl carrier protein [Bacteroidales bacterium]
MNQLNEFTQKFKAQYIDGTQFEMLPHTAFRKVGSWDSLTGMAVLVMIQEEYKIDIPVDKFKGLITVQDVYNFILENENQK